MRSTVIVGYDRSLSGGRALFAAGREAAARGSEVTVVHAYDQAAEASAVEGAPAATRDGARQKAVATAAFGAAVLRRHYPGLTVRTEAAPGAPHEVLVAAARCAGLLVLGIGDGSRPEDRLAIPLRVLARTPGPTMVARGSEREPRHVVIAAIDLDDPPEEVLNFAFAEARFRSALLRVVSARDLTALHGTGGDAAWARGILAEDASRLDRIVKERQDRCPQVRVETQAVDGPLGEVLTAATARADVIVAGAHRLDGGRYGVRVGPVARTLMGQAACPVVLVPIADPQAADRSSPLDQTSFQEVRNS